MGLHLNIDQIHADNKLKPGVRKYVGVLINEGDKLTKEEKLALRAKNERKYGVPESEYSKYVLPEPHFVSIFSTVD